MTATLHVFALNEATEIRHTNLTRQQGEAPDLPPLHDWLGVRGLNTDRIELFPVADLDGLGLPNYLTSAYDVEASALARVSARLNALDGPVLLVPGDAIDGELSPGSRAREIAALPMTLPDHSGRMAPAIASAAPPTAPSTDPVGRPKSGSAMIVLVALILAALLIWVLA